jgi:hypothetical protein
MRRTPLIIATQIIGREKQINEKVLCDRSAGTRRMINRDSRPMLAQRRSMRPSQAVAMEMARVREVNFRLRSLLPIDAAISPPNLMTGVYHRLPLANEWGFITLG